MTNYILGDHGDDVVELLEIQSQYQDGEVSDTIPHETTLLLTTCSLLHWHWCTTGQYRCILQYLTLSVTLCLYCSEVRVEYLILWSHVDDEVEIHDHDQRDDVVRRVVTLMQRCRGNPPS